MGKYFNLFVSAISAGLAAGCAVYPTSPDKLAPCVVAGIATFATAIVQQMRQWPREEWSDEKRADSQPPKETQ